MRTVLHIAIILLVGVGLGITIRSLRNTRPNGPHPSVPAEGEEIYSNDDAVQNNASLKPEDVANDEPTKPPADEAWLSRFQLTERDGETVASDDLKGMPYVVSFFFSTCPSICVQQNQKLKELQDEFKGRGVKFLAISVDPENDTPEVLREYATRFGADEDQWLFLTGDLTYIRRIGAEIFQQPVDKQFHTERFVLVDPQGKIEGFYNWPEKKQLAALRQSIEKMIQKES